MRPGNYQGEAVGICRVCSAEAPARLYLGEDVLGGVRGAYTVRPPDGWSFFTFEGAPHPTCGLTDVLVPPWVPDVVSLLSLTATITGRSLGHHELHAALRHLSRRPSLRAELLTLSRVAPKVFRQRLRDLRPTFKPCPHP